MRKVFLLLLFLIVVPSVQASGADVGRVVLFGGSVVPSGWLLCDGAAVSRSVYSDLFGVIGTAYGVGDGSTTFNLPDFEGRFPLGDDGATALGDVGGAAGHVLTIDELPSHNHTYDGFEAGAVFGDGSVYVESAASENTSSVGGGASHNNMPPYLVLNYIIAAVPLADPITQVQASQMITALNSISDTVARLEVIQQSQVVSISQSLAYTVPITSTGEVDYIVRREFDWGTLLVNVQLLVLILLVVFRMLFNSSRGLGL